MVYTNTPAKIIGDAPMNILSDDVHQLYEDTCADYVGHIVAGVEVAQFDGTESHLLYHQRDGAPIRVGFGNGERHALALLVNTYDNKVSGLAALCDKRSLYFEKIDLFRELLLADNFIHNVMT